MIGVPNGDKSGTNPATFGSGPQAAKRSSFTTTDPKTGKPIAMIRARRDDLPLIAADKTLAIGIGHRQVRFAMSDAAEALKALAACETDLLKTWGYDPATIATMPKPIAIATWLEDKDYPGSALSQNQAGETNFRLAVGVDGKPTACSVTLASGAPALDASACAVLMKRARFEPATGTDGKPVPGLFAHSVMWMMGPMRTN
jgi:TonB family protein